MSNWVTLPNGVHIDLDDPHNPLTGDGSFESYLGGGEDINSKIEALKQARKETIKKYNKTGENKYSKHERELASKIDELKNERFENNRSKENSSVKKSASLVKNYGMPVAVNWNGVEYPIGDEPDQADMASIKNEYGLEKLGTVKVEGKTYTIYGSGFGNLEHGKQVAVEEIDDEEEDEYFKWYNSLSKADREYIDRHMNADKKPGAKYKR